MSALGVLLEVAYEGTHFSGWAPQKNARTVAGVLAGAIAALDPHASLPRGTSRTDAGVHAEGQLVAFDATRAIDPRGWVLGLNRHLPDDVAVRRARFVPPGYNPRFATRSKLYRYSVRLDRLRNPLERTRAWHIPWPLDIERLVREAGAIEGKHDFRAFRSAHDTRHDTVRHIMRADVDVRSATDLGLVTLRFEGDGFLYNMVRILVGTLVDAARGRLHEGAIARALEGCDRRLAGTTAPPHGLTLERVTIDLPAASGEPWPP